MSAVENTLALDLGQRRTGVAWCDAATGVPLPLRTLTHLTTGELLTTLEEVVRAREIRTVVVGLPLLPGGSEGSQATLVRSFVEELRSRFPQCTFHFLDERETTKGARGEDRDASAALAILQTYLERREHEAKR